MLQFQISKRNLPKGMSKIAICANENKKKPVKFENAA